MPALGQLVRSHTSDALGMPASIETKFGTSLSAITGLMHRQQMRCTGCNELLDQPVGDQLQRLRHLDAECPRRLQVDDELEFGRLQHRQISGVRALKDSTGV